jgi:hypothetical protein
VGGVVEEGDGPGAAGIVEDTHVPRRATAQVTVSRQGVVVVVMMMMMVLLTLMLLLLMLIW